MNILSALGLNLDLLCKLLSWRLVLGRLGREVGPSLGCELQRALTVAVLVSPAMIVIVAIDLDGFVLLSSMELVLDLLQRSNAEVGLLP